MFHGTILSGNIIEIRGLLQKIGCVRQSLASKKKGICYVECVGDKQIEGYYIKFVAVIQPWDFIYSDGLLYRVQGCYLEFGGFYIAEGV